MAIPYATIARVRKEIREDRIKNPSSGTTVIANPILIGNEDNLNGLQVGDVKYKISTGGTPSEDAPYIIIKLTENTFYPNEIDNPTEFNALYNYIINKTQSVSENEDTWCLLYVYYYDAYNNPTLLCNCYAGEIDGNGKKYITISEYSNYAESNFMTLYENRLICNGYDEEAELEATWVDPYNFTGMSIYTSDGVEYFMQDDQIINPWWNAENPEASESRLNYIDKNFPLSVYDEINPENSKLLTASLSYVNPIEDETLGTYYEMHLMTEIGEFILTYTSNEGVYTCTGIQAPQGSSPSPSTNSTYYVNDNVSFNRVFSFIAEDGCVPVTGATVVDTDKYSFDIGDDGEAFSYDSDLLNDLTEIFDNMTSTIDADSKIACNVVRAVLTLTNFVKVNNKLICNVDFLGIDDQYILREYCYYGDLHGLMLIDFDDNNIIIDTTHGSHNLMYIQPHE